MKGKPFYVKRAEMRLLEELKWRYATKKFDATKRVSAADMAQIKEAIQLTATSYGLQLFKVLVIEDQEVKEKLKPVSWGQSQVTDASHVLVLCNYTEVTDAHLNEYAEIKAKTENVDIEKLSGYVQFVSSTLSKFSPEEINIWTAKQTYIALANLMNACAALKIDSCPMEGFDAAKYDEILGLKERGLSSALVCPIGYRSEEDASQHAPKVRRPLEDLFEQI